MSEGCVVVVFRLDGMVGRRRKVLRVDLVAIAVLPYGV